MKRTKFFAVLFAAVGICAALTAVVLSFACKDSDPVLLTNHYLAKSQAVALMNSLCRGDFDGVSERIMGQPDLGADREPAEEVGGLLWDAYLDSLSYKLDGECYTTNMGLAQKVKLTCLNMDSITQQLRDRSLALLEERVDQSEDLTEVYDDNDDYRKEFVMSVLYDAAEALVDEADEKTVELTLNLSYHDGQWWVVADNALLDVLSGGIL